MVPPDWDGVPPLMPHLRSREGAKKVTSDSELLAVPHHRAVPLCAVQRCPAETSAAPVVLPVLSGAPQSPQTFSFPECHYQGPEKISGQAGERTWQASCLGLTLNHTCCPCPSSSPMCPHATVHRTVT